LDAAGEPTTDGARLRLPAIETRSPKDGTAGAESPPRQAAITQTLLHDAATILSLEL
jgi:hypothetical protein